MHYGPRKMSKVWYTILFSQGHLGTSHKPKGLTAWHIDLHIFCTTWYSINWIQSPIDFSGSLSMPYCSQDTALSWIRSSRSVLSSVLQDLNRLQSFTSSSHPRINLRCWGLRLGPLACQPDTQPPSYGSPPIFERQTSFSFSTKKNFLNCTAVQQCLPWSSCFGLLAGTTWSQLL